MACLPYVLGTACTQCNPRISHFILNTKVNMEARDQFASCDKVYSEQGSLEQHANGGNNETDNNEQHSDQPSLVDQQEINNLITQTHDSVPRQNNHQQKSQVDIKNLLQYEGAAKLRELANNARADSVIRRRRLDLDQGTEPVKVSICTVAPFRLGIQSTTSDRLDNVSTANNSVAIDRDEPSTQVSTSSRPITRSVRKSMEDNVSRQLEQPNLNTSQSSQHASYYLARTKSQTLQLPTIHSSFLLPLYSDTKPIQDGSSVLSSVPSSPTSVTALCSPSHPSLSSLTAPQPISSVCNPYLNNENPGSNSPTHPADDEGPSISTTNWEQCVEQALGGYSYYNHGHDVASFITDTMETDVDCETENYSYNRDADDADWVDDASTTAETTKTMLSSSAKSPELRTSESPVLTLSPESEGKSDTAIPHGLRKDPACLLVMDEIRDDLVQDIKEALQSSIVLRLSSLDTMKLFNTRGRRKSLSFKFIWIHLDSLAAENVFKFVEFLRSRQLKDSNGTLIIAVCGATLDIEKSELLRRGFDDFYVEPLPVDQVRQKYHLQQSRFNKGKQTDVDRPLMEHCSTPEGMADIDEFERERSEGTDRTTATYAVKDLNLEDMKVIVPHKQTRPYTSSKKCYDFGSSNEPPSPRYSRAEHASKEKHRRERIKDSCDQLRKLLPYVRGRKTDMASILEMTVDYLKLVNTALPKGFQNKVTDILCESKSNLGGRVAHKDAKSCKEKDNSKSLENTLQATSLFVVKQSDMDQDGGSNGLPTSCRLPTVKNINLSNTSRPTSAEGQSSNVKNSTFTTMADSKRAKLDINANITSGKTSAPQNGFPSNLNVRKSNIKRSHSTLQSHDRSSFDGNISSGALNTENEINVDSHNLLQRSLQFPHMFTEGNISANRMLSSDHVTCQADNFLSSSHSSVQSPRLGAHHFPLSSHTSVPTPRLGADHFPLSSRSSLLTPRLLVSTSEANNETVAAVNNLYLGATHCYFPPTLDSCNGNFLVNANSTGISKAYVNPNAILPMTLKNSSSGNQNLNRRYECLAVSEQTGQVAALADAERAAAIHRRQQKWRCDKEPSL